jgi:para-nitrobenzyl esterase
MAELRAVAAERFGRLKGLDLSTSPVPISGDKVLPQSVQHTFAAGQEAPLALILGNPSDDASVAAGFGVNTGQVIKGLGSKGIFVKVLYPGVKDDRELGRQAARDLIFTMPARWIADRHSKLAPTWRYYFDYTAVRDRAKNPNGVPHGAEIVYFLDTAYALGSVTEEDQDYARRASEYCFESARTGKPSSHRGPRWPNHNVRQDETMLFGKTINPQANFMKTRLNLMIGGLKFLGPLMSREGN